MNLSYIFGSLLFRGIRAVRQSYMYIIMHLTMPLSILFIVGVISNGTLLPFALAGGVVMSIASGFNGTAYSAAIFRLDDKYQDMIVATKTGPVSYMFGSSLSNLIWMAPGILLYLLLDAFYHLLTPSSLLVTIIIVVPLILFVEALAFMLSSLVKHVRALGAYTTIIAFLLTVLPPTFYPYTHLSGVELAGLSLIPVTPAAVLEQGIFGLEPMHWYMLAVLIVEAVVYFSIAVCLTRWRER